MITVALQGGIGNQLFQWALGQALCARGQEVQYDTGLFDHDPGRRYMLDQLGLKLRLSHHGGKGPIIREKSLRFDPAILDTKGDAVLIGYWQSEKYFPAGLEDQITIPALPSEWRQYILKSPWSCFVHVRRSDNLRAAGIAVHGLLSAPDCAYYANAMRTMRELVKRVRFFVFSDDPAWCEQNFSGPDVVVVSGNEPSFTVDEKHDIHFKPGGREVEDLWLMTECRDGIIANSTFSWWAAWLSDARGWKGEYRYRGRNVIAPDRWFASTELDATDICPARWEKVPIR